MTKLRFSIASLLAVTLPFSSFGCITRTNGLTRVAPETLLRELAETDRGLKIAFDAGPEVFIEDPELDHYCRSDFATIRCSAVQWQASPLLDVDIPGAVRRVNYQLPAGKIQQGDVLSARVYDYEATHSDTKYIYNITDVRLNNESILLIERTSCTY